MCQTGQLEDEFLLVRRGWQRPRHSNQRPPRETWRRVFRIDRESSSPPLAFPSHLPTAALGMMGCGGVVRQRCRAAASDAALSPRRPPGPRLTTPGLELVATVLTLSCFATVVSGQISPLATDMVTPDPDCPCISDMTAHLNSTVSSTDDANPQRDFFFRFVSKDYTS